MVELVYVDEQEMQARQVLRSAVASKQFEQNEVKDLMPAPGLDETIQLVLAQDCKVLITDYRLSDHKPDVEFSGADLVREFQRRFDRFPCFVTTSFPEEAVTEPIDTNIIFPKSDFLGGDADVEEEQVSELPFFVRVRKKIAEYETFVSRSIQEWRKLLNKSRNEGELNSQDVERLLELDDMLEALHGKHVAVEHHLKRRAIEPFDRLIESTEKLIDKIESEIGR